MQPKGKVWDDYPCDKTNNVVKSLTQANLRKYGFQKAQGHDTGMDIEMDKVIVFQLIDFFQVSFAFYLLKNMLALFTC